MVIYKTFIGKTGCDIALPLKINKKKLVIICPGLPTNPSNYDLLDFLSNNGFLCIYVRYSGTWGSYGSFLKDSPVKDIENIINIISKEKSFIDSSNNQKVKLNFKEIILLGSSFGGSVCLVSGAKFKNVNKIIALSPIVNYRDHARNFNYPEEKLDSLGNYLRKAYGKSYNFTSPDWKKFIEGKLDMNPDDYLDELGKKEIILFSGAKDKSISINRLKSFFDKLSSKKKKHYIFKNLGHLSFRRLNKKVLKKVLN